MTVISLILIAAGCLYIYSAIQYQLSPSLLPDEESDTDWTALLFGANGLLCLILGIAFFKKKPWSRKGLMAASILAAGYFVYFGITSYERSQDVMFILLAVGNFIVALLFFRYFKKLEFSPD